MAIGELSLPVVQTYIGQKRGVKIHCDVQHMLDEDTIFKISEHLNTTKLHYQTNIILINCYTTPVIGGRVRHIYTTCPVKD